MGAYDEIHSASAVAVVGRTVVAAGLASVGHRVVGLGIDAEKLSRPAPFNEPGLHALPAAGLASGCLRFTASIEDAMAASDVRPFYQGIGRNTPTPAALTV